MNEQSLFCFVFCSFFSLVPDPDPANALFHKVQLHLTSIISQSLTHFLPRPTQTSHLSQTMGLSHSFFLKTIDKPCTVICLGLYLCLVLSLVVCFVLRFPTHTHNTLHNTQCTSFEKFYTQILE